jgi:hypothetical protein
MSETMNNQLVMATSPEKPEVVRAYDAMRGHYNDPACCLPVTPYMTLPATPSPFANLRKP